uniref:Fibronectin type-III domain-containing protein n=1 Tax=Angiostrongylus cantonensis TaxID=6313 RepID=A0A0K0D3H4_ANGCA
NRAPGRQTGRLAAVDSAGGSVSTVGRGAHVAQVYSSGALQHSEKHRNRLRQKCRVGDLYKKSSITEASPICVEIVEVRGKRGLATLTWSPPSRVPLYYHVRYGPAQMKGNPPFVTWQLATKKDIKVEGTVTSLDLNVTEDQDFGVCAILAQHRNRPKFGVVQVTPFHCTSCNHNLGRCGECGIVEGTTVADRSWKAVVKEPLHRSRTEHERIKVVPSQMVYRMETDLLVGDNVPRYSTANVSASQVHTFAAGAPPIAIERAEEINELATTTTVLPYTSTTSTTIPSSATTTTEEPTTPPAQLSSTEENAANIFPSTETATRSDAEKPEAETVVLLKTAHGVVNTMHSEFNAASASSVQKKEEDSSDAPLRAVEAMIVLNDEEESSVVRGKLTKELEESVQKLEKALDDVERQNGRKGNSTEAIDTDIVSVASVETAAKNAANELVNKLESASADLRHHEKSKKCLLSTGIVCNFGCESSKSCRCPFPSDVHSPDGGCVSGVSYTQCLPQTNLTAVWDPVAMNVKLRSREAFDQLRTVKNSDQVFVEFGRIRTEPLRRISTRNLLFDEWNRSRMVVNIEKLIRNGILADEPLTLHVNSSLKFDDASYGIRLCTFNSSQIQVFVPVHFLL